MIVPQHHPRLLVAVCSLLLFGASGPSRGSEPVLSVSDILGRLRAAPTDYVFVAAHRGDWRNAPENSLQSIEYAIEMGCEIVEVDVRKTLDGELVLMHDTTLDRTTTGEGHVADWTLAEIRKLKLKNGQGVPTRHKVPTLREAMVVAKGRILVYLDKTYECFPEALSVLEKTGTMAEGVFCGSDRLPDLRKKHGDLLSGVFYMPAVKDGIADLDAYVSEWEQHPGLLAWVMKYQDTESPAYKVSQRLRKAGHHVWVGTMWPHECASHDDDLGVTDGDKAWGHVIDDGASIICSDRPREVLRYLECHGRRE